MKLQQQQHQALAFTDLHPSPPQLLAWLIPPLETWPSQTSLLTVHQETATNTHHNITNKHSQQLSYRVHSRETVQKDLLVAQHVRIHLHDKLQI